MWIYITINVEINNIILIQGSEKMIHIKIDSRKVVPGDTFVAIRGTTTDGHIFIDDVIIV